MQRAPREPLANGLSKRLRAPWSTVCRRIVTCLARWPAAWSA